MKTKHIAFIIFSLIFLYFFAVYDLNFHGPDEPIYFAYTASIMEDGDLNIINNIGDIGSWNLFVSKTYNWPDNHSYGGITLWMPFYGFAKFIYSLATKLNLQNYIIWDFGKVAKCAMSFSTIVFGLFIIFLTYKLSRVFFSAKIAFYSVAMISLGTPFFYYVIHDVGQANIAGCFLSILLIWFSSYMISMKKLHWFLYGLFFSLCVAVRVELWLQMFFILSFFIILCKSKRIYWKDGIYFLIGFMPIFILRAVNAYIKFGIFHMEELLPLNTALHFYSPFNGLFSSYRSVFYTSPILYICLLGFIFLIVNTLRKHNTERGRQNLFLFILSLYLVIKLLFVRRAFGFGIDILGSRWLLAEFPIFVLLFSQALQKEGKSFRIFIFIFSLFSILWNFLIISECLTALDWVYIADTPGINARIGTIKYILDSLFYVNNLSIKLKYCLPLILLVLGLFFYFSTKFIFPSRPSFWYIKNQDNRKSLNFFSLITIYLSIVYTIVTLLNICNNKKNVERLQAKGFFKNANIITSSATKISEFEENYHHLYPLVELMRYYALRGNLKMVNKIVNFREKYKIKDFYFYPGFIKVYGSLVANYNEAGRYNKAIECYKEIIRLHPGNIDGYVGLGDIYMWIDEYTEAIESYKESAQNIPNYALIYYRLGESYYKIGEYDKAIEYFERITQYNPNFAVVAYVSLGHIYNTKGDYERAIEYFEKTIQYNPNFADAYVSLGHIYNTKGDYEKAIGYYQQTIKLNPNFADAYVNLGHVYRTKGDYEKAIGYYQQTIKLDPHFAVVAYLNLGYIYRIKGDTKNVLRQVSELKKLKRDDLANELEQSIENNIKD